RQAPSSRGCIPLYLTCPRPRAGPLFYPTRSRIRLTAARCPIASFLKEIIMKLASRFSHRSPVLRSDYPLSDYQIRTVAPSIFAETPHDSRSQRYSYIPTAAVLAYLRKEGFEPFMVCQTRVRHEDRRDFTKHMLR